MMGSCCWWSPGDPEADRAVFIISLPSEQAQITVTFEEY
jgi:hypothetical protein